MKQGAWVTPVHLVEEEGCQERSHDDALKHSHLKLVVPESFESEEHTEDVQHQDGQENDRDMKL